MAEKKYDCKVVGSGPNGLAAAITMQQAGLSVLLVEGKETIGGGLRSAELTLPGFVHDICSAIHPLAVSSPFFKKLGLEQYGLEFIYPDVAAAHPFDDGQAAVLYNQVDKTAHALGKDEHAYKNLIEPFVNVWPDLLPDILAPLHFPKHPFHLAKFGLKALPSAKRTGNRFQTKKAKGLWAGMAAHSMLPLTHSVTSAIGLTLLAAGHTSGWPIPKGGSQAIANAMAKYFVALGGEIKTDFYVHSMDQLPDARAILFDVTPQQVLKITGNRFSPLYRKQLKCYRYGMGVFKIDWALAGPIPFTAPECRRAGTVHLGGTLEEITTSEHLAFSGKISEKPYVLLAQQSLFDSTRMPEGKQTAWAYCHVPQGSEKDMAKIIENQVERFAPGFRDLILERHTMNAHQMEAYNPNYIGGDINGGLMDVTQLFTRPALRLSPYKTSAKGIYICSSSTPPGGGVHGMCGYHAAKKALRDVFQIKAMDIS